ncbi:MAG TPA: hypothetical protein VFY13_08585 [Luteolibacter sp.]|nr:hypothetical protein [Luteolibacter sp.]
MSSGVSIARWVFSGLVLLLLGACASQSPEVRASLRPGMAARDVGQIAGPLTVRFSYLAGGRKYDLMTTEQVDGPLLFESARLCAVLPDDTMPKFEQKLVDDLKRVELPFENGVGGMHAWLAARAKAPTASPQSAVDNEVGEIAVSAIALAPIAPILLAASVCSVSSDAMSGSERKRGQAVNDALLADGPGYRDFLTRFRRISLQVDQGSYQIRDYYATEGAFFTGLDYYYDVGLRDGKVLWVAYQCDAVRQQTYRCFRSRQEAGGKR